VKAIGAICVLCLATLAVTGFGRGETPTTPPVAVTGIAQPADVFAWLYGTVDPGGLETRAWFEWGPTVALGSSTPVQVVTPGAQATLSETILNLESFKTYYFRIVAANASGTAAGETVPFHTLDTLPPPNPRPPMCHVPKVVGQMLLIARRRIEKAGCRVGRQTRFVRSRRKKGIVLSQLPRGGTAMRLHAPVRLVVSRGRR